MGEKNDAPIAAFANLVLCSVASNGLSRISQNWTHAGMHANCFVHGALGFLNHTGLLVDNTAAAMSLAATRYLPIPFLMADLYMSDKKISSLYLLSGVVPFAMVVSGNDNPTLGNTLVAFNIASLCYYGMKNDNLWAWYTAGGALFAYFCSTSMSPNVMYPLSLATMEYCAYRLFRNRFDVAPAGPRNIPTANSLCGGNAIVAWCLTNLTNLNVLATN